MTRAREILQTRARALARRSMQPARESTGRRIEVMEFRLGQEAYALETRYVREALPFRDLAPLPCTPSFVVGVIAVRGQILPVIDLKRLFGFPQQGLSDLHRVIVVNGGDMELGILADMALGVRTLAADDLQAPPETLEGASAQFLRGIAADRLIVLDMERMLSDPRLIVDEEP